MVEALVDGLKRKGTMAHRYMDLGAKVLDKVEEVTGKVVHFHLHTNVDFSKLSAAAQRHGLPAPRPIDPIVIEGNGHGNGDGNGNGAAPGS